MIIKRIILERSIIAATFLSSAYIHIKIRIEVKGREANIPPMRVLFLLMMETRTTMRAVTMALVMRSMKFVPKFISTIFNKVFIFVIGSKMQS